MDEILDDLNKTENAKYQDFFVEWFKPFLYTKQKFNPMVEADKKVKIKEKLLPIETWWVRKIPKYAKISMDLVISKMKELSNSRDLNEDITICQMHNSQTVQNKVPPEIVNGFLNAKKVLR